MDLHVIAGLGNPGREYADTRHNIGWTVVDSLARTLGGTWKAEKKFDAEVARVRFGRHDCLLVKPQTFMNESGRSLGAIARFYGVPAQRFIVVYDEFQIPVGEMKLSLQGSDGGHNGIKSTMAHLGNGFARYRLGIGSDKPLDSGLKGYVLGSFSPEERASIEAALPEFVGGLRLVVDRGAVLAMNELNKRKPKNDRNAPA